MRRRPNPFTSVEGCFLSNTAWAVFFVIGFTGGVFLGNLIAGRDGATFGGVAVGILVTFTPWRRWLLAGIRRLRAYLESDPGPREE